MPELRNRRSVTFQDSENPQKYSVDATLAPLHYESELDSGVVDARVDMTPQRIQVAALDGWRVQAAGWHYGLGQRPDGRDGWVGFAGRQGAHQFWFRLERFAWLRYTNRTIEPIGSAANYNRANLANDTQTVTLDTTGEQIPVSTVATWSNIFPNTDIRWKIDGDRLKEEIIIQQAARDLLPATYPGWPVTQAYFCAVFRLDVSDLQRMYKASVLQDLTGDFDDDNGQSSLVARDTLDRLLFLLPVDDAIVYDTDGEEIARQRLRKRIYSDGTTVWLLVGLRADLLNSLPAGTLVFDPTIDTAVSASADDAEEAPDGTMNVTSPVSRLNGVVDDWMALRFANITIESGDTIDVAYISTNQDNVGRDEVDDAVFYCHNVDDSPQFTTTLNDISSRTRTTASVTWNPTPVDIGLGFVNSPSLVSIIQEIINRAGWSSGNALSILITHVVGDSGGTDWRLTFYDFGAASAPKLHIEYTAAGGGGLSIPVAMHSYRRRRAA